MGQFRNGHHGGPAWLYRPFPCCEPVSAVADIIGNPEGLTRVTLCLT